jgi:hypothetical protein
LSGYEKKNATLQLDSGKQDISAIVIAWLYRTAANTLTVYSFHMDKAVSLFQIYADGLTCVSAAYILT